MSKNRYIFYFHYPTFKFELSDSWNSKENFSLHLPPFLNFVNYWNHDINIIIQPVTAHADFKGCFMSLKYWIMLEDIFVRCPSRGSWQKFLKYWSKIISLMTIFWENMEKPTIVVFFNANKLNVLLHYFVALTQL